MLLFFLSNIVFRAIFWYNELYEKTKKPDFIGMKIFVKAKPLAKEEKVEKIDGINFIVSVKEPPIKGRANSAIIRALAEYFKIPSSKIKIISGHTSRQKIIEID